MKKRVGILISGRGSNMMALVEAARAADYPAEIAAVISSAPDAAGLAWAKAQGLPALAMDQHVTSIEPGDVVCAFTDGCLDVVDRDGARFDDARLSDVLVRAAASDAPFTDVVSRALDDFAGGPFPDDATLVALRLR